MLSRKKPGVILGLQKMSELVTGSQLPHHECVQVALGESYVVKLTPFTSVWPESHRK